MVGGKFTPESSSSHKYLNTQEKEREKAGRDPSLSFKVSLLPAMSRHISTSELQPLHYSQR